MTQTELFEYKTEKGYYNLIEIHKSGDSIRGTFFGVELNSSNKPVYFKSDFLNSKIEDKKIYFELKHFDFSYKPFYLYPSKKELIREEKEIPFILKSSLYFFGKINSDKIELNRAADIYDSRSDKMIFLKAQHYPNK